MIRCLIIADDFTGALDTGVQLASRGAATRVCLCSRDGPDFEGMSRQGVQVAVVDAETRHMSPQKAYEIVSSLTVRAKKIGIPHILKKTDSALRGNVGSELQAILDASGERVLPFLPAFPRMDRTTRKGVQYIGETPVADSVFGTDPFEPVARSYVPDIIGIQSSVRTEVIPVGKCFTDDGGGPKVSVFDTETTEQMGCIAGVLKEKKALSVMAGCAGLAEKLPEVLGLVGACPPIPSMSSRFIVVCGSVNPITRRQLDFAEKYGFVRIRLDPKLTLSENMLAADAGRQLMSHIREVCRWTDRVIIDTNDAKGSSGALEYARECGITLEQIRVRISGNLGRIVKELAAGDINSTFLMTGGDTLMGFMNQANLQEIIPIREVAAGTVLSRVHMNGKSFAVFSKSGGFGGEKLLVELAHMLDTTWEERIENEVRDDSGNLPPRGGEA